MLFDGLPFTLAQLPDLHLTPYGLRQLLACGSVRSLLRGVYVDAAVPDSLVLRARAAALVVPPHVVACRRTAAWLLGVDTLAIGAHLSVPPVELVVPEGEAPVRRHGCRGFVAQLRPEDVTYLAGPVEVRLTALLRTACALVRWLPRRDALAAVDAMLHAAAVLLPELYDGLERFAGQRNVNRARELLPLAEPRTESPGESWLRLRLLDAGFPRPQAQYEVYEADGLLVARLDLALVQHRTGLEYDGEEHHTSPADRAYDARRQGRLTRMGWQVCSFRREHVLGHGNELELAVGELLGIVPRLPRRSW